MDLIDYIIDIEDMRCLHGEGRLVDHLYITNIFSEKGPSKMFVCCMKIKRGNKKAVLKENDYMWV